MRERFLIRTIVLLLSWPVHSLWAQRPAVVPAPTPVPVDLTRQPRSAADSIPATVNRNGGIIAPVQPDTANLPSLDTRPVGAPPAIVDTVRVTARQEALIRRIVPKQATIRSLILPGLGQAYNRQYYKIPFIYAGYGVMGYLFLRYRGLANEAANGYRLLLFGRQVVPARVVTPSESLPQYATVANQKQIQLAAVYEKVEQVQIGDFIYTSTAGAKNAYDIYRRYRDLNVILSVVLYAMNAVEANVAAHLKTFDLTDDISMKVEPNVLPMPGTGLVPGVRVAFTFK